MNMTGILNPGENHEIMCDFESQERDALKECLGESNTEVRGCLFHYCQALVRNIGQHKLRKQYRNNAVFRYFIRKFMMLALLTVQDVDRVARLHLLDEAQWRGSLELAREDEDKLVGWLEYWEDTWLKRRANTRRTRTYPPEKWSCSGRVVRTNDLAEAQNWLMQLKFGSHPLLTEFVRFIQQKSSESLIRFDQLRQHPDAAPRRKEIENVKNAKLAAELRNYEILMITSSMEFLGNCSKIMKATWFSLEGPQEADKFVGWKSKNTTNVQMTDTSSTTDNQEEVPPSSTDDDDDIIM